MENVKFVIEYSVCNIDSTNDQYIFNYYRDSLRRLVDPINITSEELVSKVVGYLISDVILPVKKSILRYGMAFKLKSNHDYPGKRLPTLLLDLKLGEDGLNAIV